ncbi:MAG: dihydroorotate dehydrogenase-like protein [Spirochaetales bacterium]|nr:dihydroorotate dehydrogenase-like protein [Spirochaetales bacterium]
MTTSYIGLTLSSPVIAGSSGITDNVDNVRNLEDAGAGAVVLKSLFEEEIIAEMDRTRQAMERPGYVFPETADMDDIIDDESGMTSYLKLISDSRDAVDIPVIASVNCITAQRWPTFADMIERAGAHALELNIFLMPSDPTETDGEAFEQTYFNIAEEVRKHVKIPVSVKVGYHFTLLARTLKRLSDSGIDGLVLFNRFFNPDFDLDTLEIVPTNVLSTPELLHVSLRWIAIMRGYVACDLAASTGVHDGNAVIKQLLAGADAVQVASALYRSGIEVVTEMNERLRAWMVEKGYGSIEEFRGMLSRPRVTDPTAYDRGQFVKRYRTLVH